MSTPAKIPALSQAEQDTLDAATFRRLLQHLDENQDVQNIDLMILANFCRNCLSKWQVEEAKDQGHDIDLDAARLRVYGMDYAEWKATQPAATPEQIAAYNAKTKGC
jgi:hypothetical protein